MVLTESSMLITGTTGSGNAGRLSLFTDTLQLSGGAALLSGSVVDPISGEIPVGHGGAISVQGQTVPANSVQIDGQGSGIFTSTEGLGHAGNVSIDAHTLTLQNGGTISASTKGPASTAIGGSISINATDQVTMTNGASITASSLVDPTTSRSGIANAGNITLSAGRQFDVTNGSSITTTTQSPQANGGNIDIRAVDRIRIVDSTISTSVLGAEGNGGNIFIDPKVVILQGSEVTAKAVGGRWKHYLRHSPIHGRSYQRRKRLIGTWAERDRDDSITHVELERRRWTARVKNCSTSGSFTESVRCLGARHTQHLYSNRTGHRPCRTRWMAEQPCLDGRLDGRESGGACLGVNGAQDETESISGRDRLHGRGPDSLTSRTHTAWVLSSDICNRPHRLSLLTMMPPLSTSCFW